MGVARLRAGACAVGARSRRACDVQLCEQQVPGAVQMYADIIKKETGEVAKVTCRVNTDAAKHLPDHVSRARASASRSRIRRA